MHAARKSTIMTNEHTSLEKYTSYTLFEMVAKGLRKGYVWDVSWRLNRDCNILTPSSSVFSSTSFSFCWAAQLGALRAQPSAESWFSLPRTATTDSKLTELPVAPVISLFVAHLLPVIVASAPNSTRPLSRLYPDIFNQMHLFLDWQLGRRSICYIKRPRWNLGFLNDHKIFKGYKPPISKKDISCLSHFFFFFGKTV